MRKNSSLMPTAATFLSPAVSRKAMANGIATRQGEMAGSMRTNAADNTQLHSSRKYSRNNLPVISLPSRYSDPRSSENERSVMKE